jgi:hypothetical protein
MDKKAVELTLEELAALGARAARRAADAALDHGLVITGTLDVYEGEQPKSVIAQLHASGTVTLLEEGKQPAAESESQAPPARPRTRRG